jgi:hypothetical protein
MEPTSVFTTLWCYSVVKSALGAKPLMKAKLVLGIAVALMVALAAGWAWGTWSHSDTAGALQAAELRSDLLGARAAVLDARVATYSVNFGEASAHLENARGLLRRADERLTRLGRVDEATLVSTALAAIDEAQRMAGKLDQNANTRAGDAAKVLADIIARLPVS